MFTLNPPSRPARALLDELHMLGTTFDADDRYKLPAWLITACKYVGPVEKATLRVTVPHERPEAELPLLIESVALRLAIWDAGGRLAGMSGQSLAAELQTLYGPRHPSALRRAAYGLALLATLDGLGLITATCSTLIDGDYRPARLYAVVRGKLE